VRSDSLSIAGLRARVRDLLDDSAIHLRAREMGRSIAGYDPVARLTAVVDEVLRG
jgi:UDP:flavonoid glycosyltransferase YjiC (YdhE family)